MQSFRQGNRPMKDNKQFRITVERLSGSVARNIVPVAVEFRECPLIRGKLSTRESWQGGVRAKESNLINERKLFPSRQRELGEKHGRAGRTASKHSITEEEEEADFYTADDDFVVGVIFLFSEPLTQNEEEEK